MELLCNHILLAGTMQVAAQLHGVEVSPVLPLQLLITCRRAATVVAGPHLCLVPCNGRPADGLGEVRRGYLSKRFGPGILDGRLQ